VYGPTIRFQVLRVCSGGVDQGYQERNPPSHLVISKGATT
jgi:hypothetical protein